MPYLQSSIKAQTGGNSLTNLRATVTLATVLLLIAISQRFKTRGVGLALLVTAALLLCFPVFHILTLHRA
jgi:hypothetical protein